MWQNTDNNKYAFSKSLDKKECAYMDGHGYIHKTPKQQEKQAIKACATALGIASLCLLFISLIGSYILNRYFMYSSTSFYDMYNNRLVSNTDFKGAIAYVVFSVLRWGVPMVVFCRLTKISHRELMPLKFGDADSVESSLPFVLIAIALARISNTLYFIVLRKLSITIPSYTNIYSDDMKAVFAFTFFRYIILAVLVEIFVGGTLLRVFGQFGGSFAIFVCCIFEVIFSSNIFIMPYTILLSLVVCYWTYKSGSLAIGIMLHVSANIISYLSWLISFSFPSSYAIQVEIILYSSILFLSVATLLRKAPHKTGTHDIDNSASVLGFREKLVLLFSNGTLLLAITIFTISSVISVVFVE